MTGQTLGQLGASVGEKVSGCERFADCPVAEQSQMIGERVCMPVLVLLDGLSVNTAETRIETACETVREAEL
jgi:hypothetical protein